MRNRYKGELLDDLYTLTIRTATALAVSAAIVAGATVGGLAGKWLELRVLQARMARCLPVAPMLAEVSQ